MNKIEVLKKIPEGTVLKFLATLTPPLIYLWEFDPKSGDPLHENMAFKLRLLNWETDKLNEGVKAGKATIKDGDLILNGYSTTYEEAYPTLHEFQKITEGNIQVISAPEGNEPLNIT